MGLQSIEGKSMVEGKTKPAWVADKARCAELMRTRSSRAGDFHSKICGSLDRAEAAERKREFAARKAIP